MAVFTDAPRLAPFDPCMPGIRDAALKLIKSPWRRDAQE